MAVVRNLSNNKAEWQACGVPLLAMMTLEQRGGTTKPVIKKTLVDLDGPAFQYFAEQRQSWVHADDFRYAGPIQYFGPLALTDRIPLSLALQHGGSPLTNW
jgi:pyrophosphate--fructose-6-phosphate 1-phosphotransferase